MPTVTERLVEAAVKIARLEQPLPTCEHVTIKSAFYVPALQERYDRLCPPCLVAAELRCDRCGIGRPFNRVYLYLRVERSGKDLTDNFVAVLCDACGGGVPNGTIGTFLEIFDVRGRTTFLAYKRGATRRIPEPEQGDDSE